MELTGMLRARITGVSIDEIAEHFEVSRRTAERMLGSLRDRFPEVEPEIRDGRKYWRIPRSATLMAIELPEEVAMLNRRVAELEAIARTALTSGEDARPALERVLRIARRIRQTANAAPFEPVADLADSDRSSA